MPCEQFSVNNPPLNPKSGPYNTLEECQAGCSSGACCDAWGGCQDMPDDNYCTKFEAWCDEWKYIGADEECDASEGWGPGFNGGEVIPDGPYAGKKHCNRTRLRRWLDAAPDPNSCGCLPTPPPGEFPLEGGYCLVREPDPGNVWKPGVACVRNENNIIICPPDEV